MGELNQKEEIFAQEFVLNGGNATEAWRKANPNSKAKVDVQYSKASTMLAQEKVKARIEELKGKARGKAEERFCITVEQRLKWLKEITEAGLDTYIDQNQNKRRENLAAARAAIATMKDMLGVTDGESKDRKKFNITLRVEDASLPE